MTDIASPLSSPPLRVLLVDPSLFTPTYDNALTEGLAANGVQPAWAIRHPRVGEDEDDLAKWPAACHFYALSERGSGPRGRWSKALKGVEHWIGLRRLAQLAKSYDVVHFQWTPLPVFDAAAIRRIRRTTPVILTVHDITPLNGAKQNSVQVRGFDDLFSAASHLIVHTGRARAALIERGVAPEAISVIPHGPMPFRRQPSGVSDKVPGRWRIVLFGRLKQYKGVDLLIEALGRLPQAQRDRLEVVVAGEPSIPTDPLRERAAALGLTEPTLKFVFKRLTDQEIADLLADADSFVFPYRTIDASGVLFLVASLNRWLIASPLGSFKDVLEGRSDYGRLIDPEDSAAFADALIDSIGRVPPTGENIDIPSWETIGRMTADLYRSLTDLRS